MELKPYLVDVPVKVAIWIRPDCQRKQFEVIKKARPSKLFLVSDGGRNEEEWQAIYQNRKMYEDEIDWQCEVTKIYNDENLGLYATGRKAGKIIWEKIEYGIFLEDDLIPSVSYFRYCAELLEKYKDDERIECICGGNHLGIYGDVTADYFFSRQGGGWASATWKRVLGDRCYPDEYGNDPYIMKCLKDNTKGNRYIWKTLVGYTKNDMYGGHVQGSEFFTEFNMYAQNRLQIVPKKNMICCVGATGNAAHSDDYKTLPKGSRRVYCLVAHELEFPLKHPKFVIPDIAYEKKRNRIEGHNHPIIRFIWKIKRILLLIRYGRFKYIWGKLLSIGKEHIET